MEYISAKNNYDNIKSNLDLSLLSLSGNKSVGLDNHSDWLKYKIENKLSNMNHQEQNEYLNQIEETYKKINIPYWIEN